VGLTPVGLFCFQNKPYRADITQGCDIQPGGEPITAFLQGPSSQINDEKMAVLISEQNLTKQRSSSDLWYMFGVP
jgi:hypothetical protein